MPSDPFAQNDRPQSYYKRKTRRDVDSHAEGDDDTTSREVMPFFDALARVARFTPLDEEGADGETTNSTTERTPEQITRYHLDGSERLQDVIHKHFAGGAFAHAHVA